MVVDLQIRPAWLGKALFILLLLLVGLLPTSNAFAADAPRMDSKLERGTSQYVAAVTWSGVSPSGKDTVGMYKGGAPDTQAIETKPVTGSTGTTSFTIPRENGKFEFRLFVNGRLRYTLSYTFSDEHYRGMPLPGAAQPAQPAQPAQGSTQGTSTSGGQSASPAGSSAQSAPAGAPASAPAGASASAATPAAVGPIFDITGVEPNLSYNAQDRVVWAVPGESTTYRLFVKFNEEPIENLVRQLTWLLPDGSEAPAEPGAVEISFLSGGRFNLVDELTLPTDVAHAWIAAAASAVPARYAVAGTDGKGRERKAEAQFSVRIDAAATHPVAPVMAWYYPQFSKDAPADVANMQRAGIDTVIISQTGHAVGGTLAAAPVTLALRGTNMTFAVGIETNVVYISQEHMVKELKRILERDVTHPRYVRYNGKPVLVFWALPHIPLEGDQTPQQAWASVREQVDPERSTVWIAEGGDVTPGTGTMTYLPTFDGLHLYSVAWDANPDRALQGWERRVRSADPNKLWVATVMPGGYYGAGIVSQDQWSYREREDGAYLEKSWNGAIATRPSMVIITSYNEEKERTGIYPSPDSGPDPDRYLDLNWRLSERFRAAAGVPPYTRSSLVG